MNKNHISAGRLLAILVSLRLLSYFYFQLCHATTGCLVLFILHTPPPPTPPLFICRFLCTLCPQLFSRLIFIDSCRFQLNVCLESRFDYSRFPKEIQDFSPDQFTTLGLDSEVQYGQLCFLELLSFIVRV